MKLFSTYKAKLIGLLITCVSLACFGISMIAISAMKKNSISIFENQGISIIQKAQKHINGNYFEELIETKDDTSRFYKNTHQNLLALKKHTECSYLYTLSTKDGKNFSYVIDASDEFYSDEVEKIGTPVDVTEDINEITKAITERAIVPTEMYFTDEWGWIISFYGPIINSQDKVIGVVACDFLVADFLSQIKKVALLIGIASVIFLVVFVIVQAIYLSYFFNKLNDVTKAMNNIATGESDLTARIQFLNDNELGQLSKACNTVMEKLQSMIHTVKESVSGLQEKSSALHSNSETTLNKIATIKEDVSDIDNQVENQNSLATTVSQNVQNLHNVIDSLTNNISEQTNAISQSSTAIEEITANIDSITKNINSMSVEYESIVKDTKEGKRLQDLVKKQVEEIEEKASDLQNANVIITNISA
ncbi:MAG: methyl-accepting chemotaxis protein, partial [Treponema sp.]|nr:methyl-accepting chemotaxis protein [Treponema sp.]